MLSIRTLINISLSKPLIVKLHAKNVLLVFFAILLFKLSACHQENPDPQKPLIDTSQFQEGDFILRRGYGLVSTFIAKNYGGKHQLSHVGIVVKRDAQLRVIHSISKQLSTKEGVIEESLATFISEARPGKLFIYSPLPGNYHQRQLIATTAKRLAAANTAFDMDFNLNDTTKLFCTELVLYCLQKAAPHDSLAGLQQKPLSKGLDLFEDDSLFSLKFVWSKNQ